MRLLSFPVCLALAAGAMGACAKDDDTVTVLAASSLTDVFDEIESAYEDEHSGTTVRISYAGSSTLAQQVVEGAPADVLATANPETMATVTDEGLTDGDPEVFTTNSAVIVVPSDNPANVTGLADLAEEDRKIAVCAPEVPCGVVASETAETAGVELAPDTEESNVRSVLAKVAAGEADAGIVYGTDVTDEVEAIDIPKPATTEYPIAVLDDAVPAANSFRDFVLGDAGQQALTDAGFGGA